MHETATTENLVNLTAPAAAAVKQLLAQPENAGKHLRVYVEQGGCSGMQYGMVFDEKRDADLIAEPEGVSVLLDPFSAKYLGGAVVDFSDALTGGGFKITNPNARQSCGCGIPKVSFAQQGLVDPNFGTVYMRNFRPVPA